MDKPIKIFIVDHSDVLRKMLANILSSDPEIEFVGESPSVKTALLTLDEYSPDMIMITVGPSDDLAVGDVYKQFKAIMPGIHIILCIAIKDVGSMTPQVHAVGADFVTIPFNKNIVLKAIKDHINRA
ncbi:MAG: hypothetical protein FWE82_01395 [Defluviitaleaceae bacterium]|nr:hypothetical protein [Defluviitaleaceae bacterium]